MTFSVSSAPFSPLVEMAPSYALLKSHRSYSYHYRSYSYFTWGREDRGGRRGDLTKARRRIGLCCLKISNLQVSLDFFCSNMTRHCTSTITCADTMSKSPITQVVITQTYARARITHTQTHTHTHTHTHTPIHTHRYNRGGRRFILSGF